ncbi:Phosphate acetyltransferase [plant metagenome]|uniref:Phosphate acetyltransferase n=1 Tax=plant metagenome TaxID=1297885 RepID=A0A484P7D7_9ZZZZ
MSGARLKTYEEIAVGHAHTLTRQVTAVDVDVFEALSGDDNPLHRDDDFAARTVFGRRVVHGLFTGALVSTAHTRLTGPGFVYVGQELRFLGAVHIGDTLSVTVTVVEKKDTKRILVMETQVLKNGETPVMSGRSALKELPWR